MVPALGIVSYWEGDGQVFHRGLLVNMLGNSETPTPM